MPIRRLNPLSSLLRSKPRSNKSANRAAFYVTRARWSIAGVTTFGGKWRAPFLLGAHAQSHAYAADNVIAGDRSPRASGLKIDHPAIWGFLLGAGYIIGELPNSLVKRQLDIVPGAATTGWEGALFWVMDQLDSVIHPLVAAIMVASGLKLRIG